MINHIFISFSAAQIYKLFLYSFVLFESINLYFYITLYNIKNGINKYPGVNDGNLTLTVWQINTAIDQFCIPQTPTALLHRVLSLLLKSQSSLLYSFNFYYSCWENWKFKPIMRCKISFTLRRRRNLKTHQSPFILDKWKLGQGNHRIIMTSSFSKSSWRFQNVSVHTKTQRQRFQIPSVWRMFSKEGGKGGVPIRHHAEFFY